MNTLHGVLLSADVHCAVLTHALAAEKEEMMGLLLGDWTTVQGSEEENTHLFNASITDVVLLVRSDKRADRVEIAADQLIFATQRAEQSIGTDYTRCWMGTFALVAVCNAQPLTTFQYHSHPNITVFPSHIDLQTQSTQQMADPRFVGLICSCFHKEADLSQRIKLTAFQSDTHGQRRPIPITISGVNGGVLPMLTSIAHTLYEELCTVHGLTPEATTFDSDPIASEESTSNESVSLAKRLVSTNEQSEHKLVSLQRMTSYGAGTVALVDGILQPLLNVYQLRAQRCDEKLRALERNIEQRRLNYPRSEQSLAVIDDRDLINL